VSQELYNLLKEGESQEIPWHVAAEHMLKLKIASGGLLPEDIEELREEAEKVKVAESAPITRDDIAKAVRGGYLSGIRSTVSGDMSRRNLVRRKRGERVGKTLGSMAGAAGGALVSQKNRLAGAALGSVLGYTGGKAFGEEVDARRIRSRMRARPVPKAASIEKNSDFGKEAEEKRKSPVPAIAGGAAIGAGVFGVRQLLKTMKGKSRIGAALNVEPSVRKTLASLARSLKNKGSREVILSSAVPGAAAGAAAGGVTHAIRRKLRSRKLELEKKAQEPMAPVSDDSIPVEAPIVPQLDPMQEAAQEAAVTGKQDPVAVLLQAQQAANEAEFYKQKAEEAEMAAEQEAQRAEMADQQAQESAMREQQIGQQAQVATQQAQIASQDSVQARNESLQAQQSNIQLRQAVTNFRQSLMDLVAQDPTQVLGPPSVPQGPMPMGPEGGTPPPGPEGMPPEQAPPGAGPPPEAGGPPMAPPPQPLPEMPPPPGPMGPPTGPPPGPAAPPQGVPKMGPPPGPPAGPAA
jgi:hypothetical protein